MNLKNARVLVVGMAKSGIEAANLALQKQAIVSLYDAKIETDLKLDKMLLKKVNAVYFGGVLPPVEQFDYLVLSPGVPPHLPFIEEARRKKVVVINEIELAWHFLKGRLIGITGTNGKTTTTALTTHILRCAGLNAKAVGNIGTPLSSVVAEDDKSVVYVVELSSYQLETINNFKLACAAILNVTPDHLARHKTMQDYIAAKLNIVNALPNCTTLLLNMDNEITNTLFSERFSAAKAFSRTNQTAFAHVEAGYLIVDNKKIIATSDIFIRGEHNLENALAAAGLASLLGIDQAAIKEGLTTFKGVAHRNEWVLSKDELNFYNDSKATNPEAAVPALKTMTLPTVLIAGGMDKGSDYGVMLQNLALVNHVVLLGETKYDIAKALDAIGFTSYTIVNDMEQAVAAAIKQAERPGNILLSPACASWDMYENFEKRGEHFKRCIRKQMG